MTKLTDPRVSETTQVTQYLTKYRHRINFQNSHFATPALPGKSIKI